tara:strand:+ start:3047 stop:3364 length:318 start_codon:yes stop_codon:yes gene_type:complete
MTSTGYIYCIESEAENTRYLGSTTHKYLSHRFNQHKYDYRNRDRRFYSSCFRVVCDPQATIRVLETFEYGTRRELRVREAQILAEMLLDPQDVEIVNIRKPSLFT